MRLLTAGAALCHSQTMLPSDVLPRARQSYAEGNGEAAAALYAAVLAADPDHLEALQRCGTLALGSGRTQDALGHFRRLVGLCPADVAALYYLAVSLRRADRPGDAAAVLGRLLAIQPAHWQALLQLGRIRQAQGCLAEAIRSYAAAAAAEPRDDDAAKFLIAALSSAGRQAEAVAACDRALRHQPDNGELWFNLGALRARRGDRPAEVERAYAEAVRLLPARPEVLRRLVQHLLNHRRGQDAVPLLRRLIALDPADVEAWNNLGGVLKGMGDHGGAVAMLTRAARLAPGFTAATLGLCMARLPMIYRSEADLAACRADYARDLRRLAAAGWRSDEELRQAAEAACRFQPYYLPYQEQCDRELQDLYGRLTQRVVAARWPEWSRPRALAPRRPGERIRVGIVSGFFRWHTIWKLFMRGWMEFDRARFQVTAYATNDITDATTRLARERFETFHLIGDPLAMAARIAADAPDVLLYPEIGMDYASAKLAAMRLAPLQCTSWGHPETSGLPTIDGFLTSDLMEPEDGEACYSERVHRLPGLGIRYDRLPLAEEPTDFGRFGIPAEATLFLCCQFLSKYLPRHDALLARIAAAHRGARFAFISVFKPAVEDCLRARLAAAFAAEGLDAARHVVFLPYLRPGQYAALNRRADVYLDSIGWSGGNTTLEAVAHGLPVVTLPGRLMRGRHSAAILQRAGVTDTIARDEDDYVALALRLAEDASLRRSVGERLAAGAERIYGDTLPLRALEDLLERLVSAGQDAAPEGL